MNIEESIKILDKFTTEHKLFNIKHSDGLEEAIETLLTAYEKQSKEIEELKKYEKYYEEMKEVNKKFIAVDKIKAKIEEVSNGTYDAKIVLESLLEYIEDKGE